MERTENMVVETLDGIIRIEMTAEGEDEMDNLRSEMLDWFEDFVKREADCNRHVVTTYEPIPRHTSFTKPDLPGSDVEYGSKIIEELKNLTSAYIVLKSLDSRCGEVVQVPIRPEEYESIIYRARKFIDHVIQWYMGGYPF